MKDLIKNIINYYNANPKFQLIILFGSIFLVIFVVYTISTNSGNIYKSLTSVDYKIESKPQKAEQPQKKSEEPTKVKRIDPPKKTILQEENNDPQKAQEQSEENKKNIQEIRKKRFDSDIEKQFEF